MGKNWDDGCNWNDHFDQGIHCYLSELNLSRGWMAALAVLLFQLANLFDPRFYTNSWLWTGFAVLVPGCLLFLGYCRAFKKRKITGSRRSRWIYLCFWAIIALGMTPYFAEDVIRGGMPSNCILLCCALMIVPVLPAAQTVILFAVYMAANLIIAFGLGASAVYNLQILIICGISCLFSCHTHQFYMRVIAKLEESSCKDFMTNIFNRRGSRERISNLVEICLRHGRPFAFYMVDIDGFKQFNDKYGHRKGDEALIAAAECLGRCFERKTDILCRYGGEEFLAAVSISSAKEAARIAERARRSVEEKKIAGACSQISPFLTISVGAAVYIPKGTGKQEVDVDKMIQMADEALYAAKANGRNRVAVVDVVSGAAGGAAPAAPGAIGQYTGQTAAHPIDPTAS